MSGSRAANSTMRGVSGLVGVRVRVRVRVRMRVTP